MKKKRHKCIKKITSGTLVFLMVFSMLSVVIGKITAKAEIDTISNPRIADDGTVTWDKITFGNYYQDAELEAEPIKWRILDIDSEGNAFLLADEALDCKPYNTGYAECTWETCTLRDWLNGTDDYANDNAFINVAFTADEQSAIIETTVENPDNPTYNTEGGEATKDKVYLLSIAEASKAGYGFDETLNMNSSTRWAKATDYAKLNNAYFIKSGSTAGNCYWWWLRSPGHEPSFAASVDVGGWCLDNGDGVSDDMHRHAVRPALHINLSSSYVKYAGTVTSDGNVTEGTNTTKNKNDYKTPIKSGDVTTWDCVYFGKYKQKAVFNKKPIEWRVLSVDGNDALVIADKALDCKPYNTEYAECTWETCTLRDWLNGTDNYANDSAFINEAFNSEEQSAIIETTVENPDNPTYNTEGGEATKDKLYLLSIAEASKAEYGFDETFNTDSLTRQAKATDYAKLNGADFNSGSSVGNCFWWLRSPGFETTFAARVDSFCCGRDYGGGVYFDDHAVRPVLHVNLSSSYVKPVGIVSSDSDDTSENIEAQTEANSVIGLISLIGDVTKDSKAAIETARAAYNALSENAKDKVTNYSVLQSAEAKLAEIEKQTKEEAVKAEKEKQETNDHNTTNQQAPTQQQQSTQQSVQQQASTEQLTTEEKVTVPAKAKIASVKNNKSKAFVVIWKKVNDVKGYEVKYALNKKFTKSKKTKDITSSSEVSFTAKKLKKGKTYYVKVRAYNTDSQNTKVYGKWSAVKKVKIKK
ncbi:MAG: fibronectin type III domain-containing protein [Lachnospiraceae bacterium]|nr:fibronectin type III domain-containing protein [Lachnospiraceae bacterium]